MSRIATGKKTARLDLGGGEWIDIRAQVSFSQLQDVALDVTESSSVKSKLDSAIGFAKLAIVNWHLLDEDGQEVPYSHEKIGDLDVDTMRELQEFVTDKYGLNKKKETPSIA